MAVARLKHGKAGLCQQLLWGGADLLVSIAQFGSTRSINASVAAGIAMHAWIRRHGDLGAAW